MCNLGGFDCLRELRLDNNNISKIQNIGLLTNLTWLGVFVVPARVLRNTFFVFPAPDLSFNQISTIEGLQTLTKLTDLSLFNNKLTAITGLSTLANLECLSLGNNQLQGYSTVEPFSSSTSLRF